MPPTRLRSGYQNPEPYPLNQFPPDTIRRIARGLVHIRAVGHADIQGDEFCRVFADAIEGEALNKPLGVADAHLNGIAWSVKTVKHKSPHKRLGERIRLISGRNSPTYSQGIQNPFADLQRTGKAVIEVYNNRISEAHAEHANLRFLVLIRNFTDMTFTLYERALHPFAANDYDWSENKRGNLEAHCGGEHCFTWQPHGSQFTILETVPESAVRFRIAQTIPLVPVDDVMRYVGFAPDWVEILDSVDLNI